MKKHFLLVVLVLFASMVYSQTRISQVVGDTKTAPTLKAELGNRYTKAEANAIFVLRSEGVPDPSYTKGAIDSMRVTAFTGGIMEIKARLASQTQTRTGVVRNVPGTYATLTAAYTAANNNDDIVLADGTYELGSESGGYWNVNTATKGVYVKGNPANRSAVVLHHVSNATYGIRLRDCLSMTFQDLTMSSSGTFAPFIMEQAYASTWVKFKNCALIQSSGGATGVFGRTSLTTDTDVIWIEFDGCSIVSNGTISPIQYTASGINETMLITNCSFSCTGLTGISSIISYKSDHKGKIAVYDSSFSNSTNTTTIQFGEDEAVPTNTTFTADFRNNSVSYTSGFSGHAVLLGRGSNKIYIVNNTISVPSTSNSLAIGFVMKTTATAVNDAYIAGNLVTAPRPFYFKGAQNLVVKFNTFVTNYPASYFAVDVSNPDAGRISTGNVLRFNNCYGGVAAIGTYDSASWEDPETTIKGWVVNNNRYYSTTGNWLNISGVNKAFSLKRTIYDGLNDCYSLMVTSPLIKISETQNYDATTTVSW